MEKIIGLKDELTGALIGLARACTTNIKTEDTDRIVLQGLMSAAADMDEETLQQKLELVREEKNRVAPDCAFCTARCGNTDDYDMRCFWEADKNTASLKSVLLFNICGVAACAYRALQTGKLNGQQMDFFHRMLQILGSEWDADQLMQAVSDAGKMNLEIRKMDMQ